MLRRLGSGKKTCLNGKYACFVRARTAARRAGDPGLEQMPLHILAATARMSGDLPAARVLAEEAIAMHESLGDGRMLAAE
jgi:hypothetical protein